MKRAIAILGLLAVTACAQPDPVVTSQRYRVVVPEESMFQCDWVERFPESRTLTDLQVARLLVELHQNNIRCRNSIQSIRNFLEDARIRIEEGREPPARPQQPERALPQSPRRVPVR